MVRRHGDRNLIDAERIRIRTLYGAGMRLDDIGPLLRLVTGSVG